MVPPLLVFALEFFSKHFCFNSKKPIVPKTLPVSIKRQQVSSCCSCFLALTGFSQFNFHSKTGLVSTTWERLYFFTQGGNLMCQPRGAVAGGLIQDLDNCSVMAVDCEDRRYCFQITTPNGKA